MSSSCEVIIKFCLDFFEVLNKDRSSQNIIFSPLSISGALGMVLLGARGNTQTQIQKVPGDQRDTPGGIHSQFHDIFSTINIPTTSYELTIANRLYGEKTPSFLQLERDLTYEKLPKWKPKWTCICPGKKWKQHGDARYLQ